MSDSRNLTFTPEEIENGKIMAILAYLGILVFIPLFAARENRYAMYHTEQGLALFIFGFGGYIAVWVLSYILSFLGFLGIIVWLGWLVFIVLGIINAAGGKAKELPVVGQFGAKFNLVK